MPDPKADPQREQRRDDDQNERPEQANIPSGMAPDRDRLANDAIRPTRPPADE